MFKKQVTTLIGTIITTLALGAMGVAPLGTAAADSKKGEIPTPEGLNGFLVYVANGVLPASDIFLDGNILQQDILGRTPAEIAQNRAEALQFYEDRFGIVDGDSNPDVTFFGFYTNPLGRYRAYVVGDEKVPDTGWAVHDGGWIMIVTNPMGITLGGEFAGVYVPVGTQFYFGDYSVERVKAGGHGTQPPPIRISYRAAGPAVPDYDGKIVIGCELYSDEYGRGRAQGMAQTIFYPDGMALLNIRNVLTFTDPPLNGL